MDKVPENGTSRVRPALPLTVPVVLALAVWAIGLWNRPGGPPPTADRPRASDDPVAVELRQFRALTDTSERVRAITRIGPVRDPRVTVALVEVVQTELNKDRTGSTETPGGLMAASVALFEHHIPEAERVYGVKYWTGALMWWETHEVEVRRRAALLPQ